MENLRYLLNWRWPPGYQGDPAPLYYRRWREIYPELAYESTPAREMISKSMVTK